MDLSALFRHWSLRFFAPTRMLRRTYDAFKSLLAQDIRSHEIMADFMEVYHEGRLEDMARSCERYRRLEEAVSAMIDAFAAMNPLQAGNLRPYLIKYDFYIRLLLAPPERFLIPPFVVDHETVATVDLVGNKSHTLLRLKHHGQVTIPDGFTITATAFFLLVEHNHLRQRLDGFLAGIDPLNPASLETASRELMSLVRGMAVPESLRQEVLAGYDRVAAGHPGGAPRMAVRSSALHEDGELSFAGQYETVLGVCRDGLLAAFLEVLASKYTPEALLYRITAGLSDEEAAMAVLVLVMVDAAASGVIYTRNPMVEGREELLIQSIHGLGQPLVSGETDPDTFTFLPGCPHPTAAVAGAQTARLSLSNGHLLTEELACADRGRLSLLPEEAAQLAVLAREAATMLGSPQDIEWAQDQEGRFIFLQSRPLGLCQPAAGGGGAEEAPPPKCTPLLHGARRAAAGCGSGRVLHLAPGMVDIPQGTVLVTAAIPPSLVRSMGRFAAVVCERGAVTGHFATICRERGLPLLVDAGEDARRLPAGVEVTVDADRGAVYPGRIEGLLVTAGKGQPRQKTPHSQRLRAVLDHITPLNLVDPAAADFRAQSCRSLHDIIRFIHEKAVQAMFGIGDMVSGRSRLSRKLETDLPLDIYLLDVGGAFRVAGNSGETIAPDQLDARPFLAVWQGLTHPDIDWRSHCHFDWKAFGDMALSGGLAAGGSGEFASYAVISPDYLNLNMRFGYHFTLVDCLCGTETRANYCQVRFAGGGGDYEGRSLRIRLLTAIFQRLGFEVTVRADLLDARVAELDENRLCDLLVRVGRLLGTTKLLDMVLKDEEDIALHVRRFFEAAANSAATGAQPQRS